MSRIELVALSLAVLFHMSHGLFLGQGGVFNSPEAQEYWNRRLGTGGLDAARAAGRFFRNNQIIQTQKQSKILPEVGKASPNLDDLAIQTNLVEPEISTDDAVQASNGLFYTKLAAQPRVVYYYIPTFQGTLGSPSPLYLQYQQQTI